MATLKPVVDHVGEHSVTFQWGPLTSANVDGHAIAERFSDYVDRSVQILGTFGAGTVHLEGSNDGTNFVVLTDPQGNAISKTTASIEQITENVLFMRPRVSGADGATSVTVIVFGRRGRGGVEV